MMANAAKGQAGAPSKKADFTVLMVGQRRAGKSSVLSSMITAMEKLSSRTGFRFRADAATKIFMRAKQSQLQQIFIAYQGQEEFCTLEGEAGGVEYSVPTSQEITYRFFLGLTSRKEGDKEQIVDFVDVPGEEIIGELSDSFCQYLAKSSVVIVAVDAPALMEGREVDGVGEFHRAVNMPDAIQNHFVQADTNLRANLDKKAVFPPKLVLFVPLKCEKYYYGGQMGELNRRLKKGYESLLSFFEANQEYTVAITPILTLGDVVFDRYETRDRGDGKQVVITYTRANGPHSMNGIPSRPLFRFRDAHPEFSPMYCEQPLMYLLAYILVCIAAMQAKKKGPSWLFLAGAYAALSIFGALIWLAAKHFAQLAKDKPMLAAMQKVVLEIKTGGDGYELLFDRLGIRGGKLAKESK